MADMMTMGEALADLGRRHHALAGEVVERRWGVEFPLAGRGYYVEWDRVTSPRDVLGWVDHLSAKSWVTKGMLQRFLNLCADHLGVSIHPI